MNKQHSFLKQMNWVDGLILVMVGWSAFSGFSRGILKEVFSILWWVGGFMLAIHWYQALAPIYVKAFKLGETIAQVAAFGSILAGTVLVSNILYWIFSAMVLRSYSAASYANNLLGLAFGVVRAALLASILALFVHGHFHLIPAKTAKASYLLTPLTKLGSQLEPIGRRLWHGVASTNQPSEAKNKTL